MKIISYLSIDEIKGISNEWFKSTKLSEGFANEVASFGFDYGGNSVVN